MALSHARKQRIIRNAARQHGIKPRILYGLWGTESDFGRNTGPSSAGALGDMQFMPGTARSMGVNPHDFHSAVYGAAKYLSQYKGRGRLGMLSAYNAGPAGPLQPGYAADVEAASKGWKGLPGGKGGGSSGGVKGTRIPGVDNSQARRLALAQYFLNDTTPTPKLSTKPTKYDPLKALQESSDDSDDLIELTQQLQGLKDVPSRMMRGKGGGKYKGNVPGEVGRVDEQLNKIDRARVPYLWGGGHARRIGGNERVTPMDCSGAVSRALGLDPRVSGAFASWGRPGRGKHITVWANANHVLLERDGRFWATSSQNPGGGAGWIGRPSAAYLSAFTPRHPGY